MEPSATSIDVTGSPLSPLSRLNTVLVLCNNIIARCLFHVQNCTGQHCSAIVRTGLRVILSWVSYSADELSPWQQSARLHSSAPTCSISIPFSNSESSIPLVVSLDDSEFSWKHDIWCQYYQTIHYFSLDNLYQIISPLIKLLQASC